MRLIIPMAGRGTRLRPHTNTVPKPLMRVAGKLILERILDTITAAMRKDIEEVVFVVGNFDASTRKVLAELAAQYNAAVTYYEQEEALGTAHAIYCAAEKLEGEVLVAFADTIFEADLNALRGGSDETDGTIWVKEVDDPRKYGVVKLDEKGIVTQFIEKPQEPVSNLAIIGVYYFKRAEVLRQHIQKLIDDDFRVKGEYQLTDALETMLQEGTRFGVQRTSQWFDCGTVQSLLDTNAQLLQQEKSNKRFKAVKDSIIIDPVFIGEGATIENSIVGPNVSIARNVTVNRCIVENSILNENARLNLLQIKDSIVGGDTYLAGSFRKLNVGDNSEIIFDTRE